MLAYLVRRLLLMIPTILGIMAVSFAIVQFVPGGPVERAIAQLQGTDQSSTAGFGGGGGQIGAGARPGRRRHLLALSRLAGPRSEVHQGAGEAVRLRQAGAGAVLDSGARLRDLPFRQELLPRHARAHADRGEAARLDFARALDDVDLLRDLDPARHPQGGPGRLALRHRDVGGRHLRLRDPELPVRGAADRAVLRRLVLADLSPARPHLRQFRRARLAAQDSRLPLAHHAAGDGAGARLLRHLDPAHQEFLPRRDQEVLCPDGADEGPERAARALRARVPQRDADRHRRVSRAPSSPPSSPARC